MKKLLSTIFTVLITTLSFSSSDSKVWKTPLHNNHVPLEVKLGFIKINENAPDVKWYPYPYGTTKLVNLDGYYSPKTESDLPLYFEAEYMEGNRVIRQVYDKNGLCKMFIKVLDHTNVPNPIKEIMHSSYDKWSIVGYETVSFENNSDEVMHKIYLLETDHIHVIYLDQDLKEQKHIDWEFYKTQEPINIKQIKTESNLNSQPQRSVEDLTWGIKSESGVTSQLDKTKDNLKMESFYVHDERDLLDFYQINNSSYDNFKGQLTEQNLVKSSEVVKINSLPVELKKQMLDTRFKDWSFEDEIEKIQLSNGSYDYKLHGLDHNKHHVITLHKF